MTTRSKDWLILKTRAQDTLVLPERLAWASIHAWSPAETVVFREGDERSRRKQRIPLAPRFVFVAAEHTHEMVAIHELQFSPHPAFSFLPGMDGGFAFCPESALKPLRLAELRKRPADQVRQWRRGELCQYPALGFEGLTGTVDYSNGKSVWVAFGPLVVEAPAVMLIAIEQPCALAA